MDRKLVEKNVSELWLIENNIILGQNDLSYYDFLPVGTTLHVTDINMNDMPSESYQRSLVLEDWTASVGTVFPSNETPSYRSDGTCSESSMHNFLHLSDTEDSITNSNLCTLFGSDCSHNTTMCINISDTDKIFNASDCQMLSTKSKENLLEGGFSPLLMSENVQNWKKLLLQVNSTEQHLKSPLSVEQTRECVNRATVVKLTPLKDELLKNNQINNGKHASLIDVQYEQSYENRTTDKELSLLNNGSAKNDFIQKSKQTLNLNALGSTKYNFKKVLKKRKNTKLHTYFKSKHLFPKKILSPVSYYRKCVNRYIYGKYFTMNCAQKYQYSKASKMTFPNDHAYSISKFSLSKRHNCFKTGKILERRKQKIICNKYTACKVIQERPSSAVCVKNIVHKDQLLNNNFAKTESIDDINISEVNNHCEKDVLSSKISTEMDMPILTPLIITESSVEESSPNSPPMPTLIPFTSENEHPPSQLRDCIPLLSSTTPKLINSEKNKNCDSTGYCEYKFKSLDHKWSITDAEDLPKHTSSNENITTKPFSFLNKKIGDSYSYSCSTTCILDHYRTSSKPCRKARKSFPRSRFSGESSSLSLGVIGESFSSTFSKPVVNTSKLQNTLNYQPVVLLERIPSVLPSKTAETENMHYNNEKTNIQFSSDTNCSSDFIEPEVDIIDGVKFLSFMSECQLKKFIKNNKSSFSSNDYDENEDENHKTMGVIIPTKTNDITRIKGWRNKLFIQEPCPSPVSYTSWEHLVIKDLESNVDFNELQNIVPKSKCEQEKIKHPLLKESNLEIAKIPANCSLELKTEENRAKSYLTEIEKDKSDIYLTKFEENSNNCLKKMGKSSPTNEFKEPEESKTNVCIKKTRESDTASFNRKDISNDYVEKVEKSDSSIPLLDKSNFDSFSKNEETVYIENKECNNELVKMLKDKTTGLNAKLTSISDILKTLPKFTKQEQKITDDKNRNNELIKRLEEKCVGKTTRSAFVSDILDDFLKTRSNLGINLLAQCNPNILPIPADSSIFSVGLLRKQEMPAPSKQHCSNEMENNQFNEKLFCNLGKETVNNNDYKYQTKHNTDSTGISSDLSIKESKQATVNKIEKIDNDIIVVTDVENENIENDKNNASIVHNTNPRLISSKENLYDNINEHNNKYIQSNSEAENKPITRDDFPNQYNFEGSSYTSRISANMKQTLPLIRNLYWSRKEQDYKRLTELYEELNNSGHSIESCSILFCPIIDRSLAEKAASALTNVKKVSNNKACNLDDYNTFGKIAATKSFPYKTTQKPITDTLKDFNHRCRYYSDLTKSPPYSNANQATRSKRLIRVPARYLDSIEAVIGTEGRILSTPQSYEFKQRLFKRKLEGEFDQHIVSPKCTISHNEMLGSLLDESSDVNSSSSKGKDCDQSANSSFSDISETYSRTTTYSPIIQEQSSTSENEITNCCLHDKNISHTNIEKQNLTFFTKTDVNNKSQMVDFENFETLSPRGRELLSCMDKVIRVSLPRLPVNPEMVIKCQKNSVVEHLGKSDSPISLDSQVFTSMKNHREVCASNMSLHQKHVAHSKNMQSDVSASSLYQYSSKMSRKKSQHYSRLKLSSFQSLNVPETIPVIVDNKKIHGTKVSVKKPTLLRVQFYQNDGEFYVRELKTKEMKKVLLRNLPSKCVQKFSYNNNRLERCKSYEQITKMHTVTSPTNSINTFMRSHRKRKQNKCKLSCCSSDGSSMEQKRNCTSSVQQNSAQLQKKTRSVSLDNFRQNWSSCEKREDSTNNSDHSDSVRDKVISERKKNVAELFDTCDFSHEGNVIEEISCVQMISETETPVSELKQISHQHEKKEKKGKIHSNQFFQKHINVKKAPHRNSSSKKMSMKFTDKCVVSLQSSGKDRQTKSIPAGINVNQLLATAYELYGHCIVKRVQLKNGKTVYVYHSMNADACSNSDDVVDSEQSQMNNKMVTEKHLREEGSSLESSNVVCGDNKNNSLKNDHNSTSVWVSGNGEPCFVTKLSSENGISFQEEKAYSLCANNDKPAVPTIISCASISEEEFAKSLNPSEGGMEIDQVSYISQ